MNVFECLYSLSQIHLKSCFTTFTCLQQVMKSEFKLVNIVNGVSKNGRFFILYEYT